MKNTRQSYTCASYEGEGIRKKKKKTSTVYYLLLDDLRPFFCCCLVFAALITKSNAFVMNRIAFRYYYYYFFVVVVNSTIFEHLSIFWLMIFHNNWQWPMWMHMRRPNAQRTYKTIRIQTIQFVAFVRWNCTLNSPLVHTDGVSFLPSARLILYILPFANWKSVFLFHSLLSPFLCVSIILFQEQWITPNVTVDTNG